MKGTTKKVLQVIAMASVFGLVSCTAPVVDPGTNTNTDTNTNTNPVASEVFVVQLIASNSSPKAEQIKNQFAADGHPAVVSAIQAGGQTLYRVQIGSYGTEADARRVLNQLKSRYQSNQHIRNAVVKTKNGI